MRICLVAESYPPALGGVEFALQKLVEGFIANGHEVPGCLVQLAEACPRC